MSKDPTILNRTNALTEYERFMVREYKKRQYFWFIAIPVVAAIILTVVVVLIGGAP